MEDTNKPQQHTHDADAYISEVLHKIQTKKISVHSKTFFRLKWLAFVLLVSAICVVSIALCSFILFTIRMTGQSYLIEFGSKGVELAFILFPWVLFLIDGVLIILLGALTRHTSFGYKIPGIYILVGAIAIISISGYIVDTKTSFHANMLYYADHKRLPLFETMYTRVRRAPPRGYEIYRGIVVKQDDQFIYIDIDDEEGIGTTSTVIVPAVQSATCFTHCFGDIEEGQTVFVSGTIVDGKIVNAQLRHAPRLPPPR